MDTHKSDHGQGGVMKAEDLLLKLAKINRIIIYKKTEDLNPFLEERKRIKRMLNEMGIY